MEFPSYSFSKHMATNYHDAEKAFSSGINRAINHIYNDGLLKNHRNLIEGALHFIDENRDSFNIESSNCIAFYWNDEPLYKYIYSDQQLGEIYVSVNELQECLDDVGNNDNMWFLGLTLALIATYFLTYVIW